jgi:hypothetical protein
MPIIAIYTIIVIGLLGVGFSTAYKLDSGTVSIKVDGLIQKADLASADHHEVMAWLNSLPTELIK